MTPSIHHIAFNFVVEQGRLKLQLEADAEVHHSDTYYVVKNFRVVGHQTGPVLPDIQIAKVDGRWVHRDSGQETELSRAAGAGIDAVTDET